MKGKESDDGVEAIVFHIAEPDAWAADASYYKPFDFEREGFVHLSTRLQVLATAQRYYAGRSDLVLLAIDTNALEKDVIYENLLGGEELFPHYYATVPRAAVLKSGALVLGREGCFSTSVLEG